MAYLINLYFSDLHVRAQKQTSTNSMSVNVTLNQLWWLYLTVTLKPYDTFNWTRIIPTTFFIQPINLCLIVLLFLALCFHPHSVVAHYYDTSRCTWRPLACVEPCALCWTCRVLPPQVPVVKELRPRLLTRRDRTHRQTQVEERGKWQLSSIIPHFHKTTEGPVILEEKLPRCGFEYSLCNFCFVLKMVDRVLSVS